MKIKIINPNTTKEMTNDICESANLFCREDTDIVCVNPDKGPATIEGFYDEYLAIPGLIEELLKSEQTDFVDAYVVACFGDPGIYALRELTEKPVVGIAEAALTLACFIAGKYSIVSIMPRMRMILAELVERVGVKHRIASIRTPDLTVIDFINDFDGCKKVLIEEAVDTIEKDHAEAIVLGCAGMTGFAAEVEAAAKVPVFDGVTSAVKVAEALVDMGMRTSKQLTFKRPEKKEVKGFPDLFQQ